MTDQDGRAYMQDGKLIVPWRLANGRVIHLLTPEEFTQLSDGTEVISITGDIKIKGKDYIDDDTRRGYLAFGLLAKTGDDALKDILEKKTIVISGFPGVGKTVLFNFPRLPNPPMFLDSDSSHFSWANQTEKIRHPSWPNNYIQHIRENLGRVDAIFVSSHLEVRNALVSAGIEFILVYPGLEMKDEYIERYVKRGNASAFVDLLKQNYETWIHGLMEQENCTHIVLQQGQYLSDVLRKFVKLS